MRKIDSDSQSGISLIEVLIILVVIGILVTLAVSQFGRSKVNLERQNIAREFKVNMERARFDSVKRRAKLYDDYGNIDTNLCNLMSRITISSPTSYSVTTDLNADGLLSTSETRTINFAGRNDVRIVGNSVTLPVTIRFDERGRAVLTDCVSTVPPDIPLLFFCEGNCTASTVNGENSNVLYISPAGTIAMSPGDADPPTFDEPDVSSVDANTNINPDLKVYDPTTPTPTPTPTATPPSTPNATPTPKLCSQGERPAETGCLCKDPAKVNGDGKCIKAVTAT